MPVRKNKIHPLERLTNNRDEYLNQIKIELLDFEPGENWERIFSYVEIPYFLSYAFSYHYLFNAPQREYRLVRKEWNAEYDHSRFDKGIYNLDRLAVIKRVVDVNMDTIQFFNAIDFSKVNTLEFNGIVLDGFICELAIEKEERYLKWNIDKEMNSGLLKLISKIRTWKREMKDL